MTDSPTIDAERERRLALVDELAARVGSLNEAPPAVVNELRIFYGGRGIWYDAANTRNLAPPGVTVGVLHTGRHYEDALEDDGLLYYFPSTASPGKDAAEVEATKNAARLGLPIFVVIQQGKLRRVIPSVVEDWDDEQGCFLVRFGSDTPDVEPGTTPHLPDFQPFSDRKRKRRRASESPDRSGQQAFAFRVRKRFGSVCAFCDIRVPKLLDAAHIIPVAKNGSDDERNGLPLCPTHHRAFDTGLITIDPLDHSLRVEGANSPDRLGITRPSLGHLAERPAQEALEWRADHPPPY